MTILGRIGSLDIPANAETQLGICDEAGTINIRICNRSANDAVVRIAIGTGANVVAKDYIEYDAVIEANQVLENTGIAVSSGEKIWVYSNVAGCSARAHGMPAQ